MDAKNTRRDSSLSPNKIRKAKIETGKSFVAASLIALVLMSGIIGVVTLHPVGNYNMKHEITVDGKADDWTGSLPSTSNTFVVSNGEYVWNDKIGDERNDFNGSNSDTRVDLTEFRVTGDSSYLYMMAKFYDLDNGSTLHLGDNGATFMAITIDNGSTGGQTYFAGESDTQVNNTAAWEYQIVVNLADSRFSGKNMNSTSYPLNESTANWGSVFYVVNSSWKFVNFAGDHGEHGLMAVNMSTNIIEIKIAWSVLGIDVSKSPTLKMAVITARGWSDYKNNQGHVWDISGASDALDCVSTEPTTWDEVNDGVVNDTMTITFSSNGDVSSGEVPEFSPMYSALILVVFIVPILIKREKV